MKLKFLVNKEGKKIYTLKEKVLDSNELTKEAHYKFIKIRDAPRNNSKIIKKH